MDDDALLNAKESLANLVSLWRLRSTPESTQGIIAAATDCLVAGLDSPTLRILAGASAGEPGYIFEQLVAETFAELDMSEVLERTAEHSAFIVIANQMKSGQITPGDLAAWAHTYIGHDGDKLLQPFVILEDMYRLAHLSEEYPYEYTIEDLDGWTTEELEAFLTGQPSPKHTDKRFR